MISMWFHPACASAIQSPPVSVAPTGVQLGGLQTMSLRSLATLPVWYQLVASWETLRPCPCAPSHPASEAPAICRPDSPLDYTTLTVAATPAHPDWHAGDPWPMPWESNTRTPQPTPTRSPARQPKLPGACCLPSGCSYYHQQGHPLKTGRGNLFNYPIETSTESQIK